MWRKWINLIGANFTRPPKRYKEKNHVREEIVLFRIHFDRVNQKTAAHGATRHDNKRKCLCRRRQWGQ